MQIDDLAVLIFVPREGQELLSQAGCAAHRQLDLLDEQLGVDVTAHLVEEQIGIPADARELIVEVMRHAAGELPDGLHLLTLPQAELELLALADVARERTAVIGTFEREQVRGDLDGYEATVTGAVSRLEGALAGLPQHRPDLRPVLRIDVSVELVDVHAQELLARMTEHLSRCVVHVDDAGVLLHEVGGVRQVVDGELGEPQHPVGVVAHGRGRYSKQASARPSHEIRHFVEESGPFAEEQVIVMPA